ncbi:MAG TPA: VOC family protein [Puia sp.]|nr:VOC family protein [Puia sp.]
MTQVNAYLSFDGNCRQVMTYYATCLEAEISLQTVGESPIAGQMPPAMKDQIMHSSISRNGKQLFMGSDMHRDKLITGNNTTLCVECESVEQATLFFKNLSKDGKVIDPLQKAFWGDTFGVLNDKYGRQWMFLSQGS